MNDENAESVGGDGSQVPARPENPTVFVSAAPRRPNRPAQIDGVSASSRKTADTWLFLEVLRTRWHWVVIGTFVFMATGFALSSHFWSLGFVSSARLIRNESPRSAEVFTYQTLTPQSYVSLLRSPELLNRVAGLANPPMAPDQFSRRLRLTPERDGDVVLVQFAAASRDEAMAFANLYATEAVRFTRLLQSNAANEVRQFVVPQLELLDSQIAELKNEKMVLPKSLPTGVSTAPSPLMLKLQKAREELVDALTQFTDTHPTVQAARAKVKALEQQISTGGNAPALPTESEIAGHLALQRDAFDMIRSEVQPLEMTRRDLIKRQHAAELVASEPPGYYRILSPALARDVKGTKREIKIGAVTAFFALAGIVAFAALALLVELLDKRLKAPADVTRVTGLPVIATAPDLDKLSQIEQRNWAFRTWKRLQGRLSPTLNHGLVCGLTSAASGEGRSTLVRSLARAASESGFRVLTVSTRNETTNGHSRAPENKGPNGHSVVPVPRLNSLPSPSEVQHKLVGPHAEPVVHIPLPGWVWNLERRKQWQSSLDEWRKIDNIVILVELPPASAPEAILLAEEIPNLIWLSDSGSSTAAETRAQLETLRSARCDLVGAILNHAPMEHLRARFARWLPCVLLMLVWNVCHAQLQQAPPAPINNSTNALPATTSANFLGGAIPANRPEWQTRFTLGPGDVLRIALFGSPEFTRVDIVVAPDGHVGFLEAQDVMAEGKTVDEFRTALDEALSKYRRAPRTMVTPVAFHSKKYCVLGKVNQRGVYPLEHQTTILEAVARAKGFEVGLRERDSIDLVDLQRSFLMRNGHRMPISFERMFLDGDLSQNVVIAPGDYLFFPSTGLKEIHVLGEVRYPGSVTYTPGLGVIGAISQRSGFNEKSYKSHVLLVRGSLEAPQTIVVNCNDILSGKAPDYQLQPKDIVYVYKRPWWRAEEVLDLAITAFLQSIVASWAGQDVLVPFLP